MTITAVEGARQTVGWPGAFGWVGFWLAVALIAWAFAWGVK